MSAEPRKGRSSRYRDIATKLQNEIRLGNHPVGELLPTETELMARHSASRQTVREALRILMDQGLIVRRAGLGSVVIATEPPVLFTHSVKSLTEWLRYSNETYRDVVASREIVADRKLAALLKCEPGKHAALAAAAPLIRRKPIMGRFRKCERRSASARPSAEINGQRQRSADIGYLRKIMLQKRTNAR